jgi:LmbE family N-acetylglucosaminyl deacetylase
MSPVHATTHRAPDHPTANPTIAGLGDVLGVWAHPDDEAYLSAGLMHLARRARSRVAVLTATAGESAGDGEGRARRRLARRRRRELAASLGELGVIEHQVAGLADGACADVPFEAGVALVERWMRYVDPDTIVTFGPDGMTGHPDHRAISAWTTAAWERSGRRSRLLYATVTPEFHRRWGAINEQIGLWMDGAGPATPAGDLALQIRCDGDLLDRKVAALRRHASQVAPLVDAMGEHRWTHWFATESFVDAALVLAGAGSPAERAPVAA